MAVTIPMSGIFPPAPVRKAMPVMDTMKMCIRDRDHPQKFYLKHGAHALHLFQKQGALMRKLK